MPRRHACLVALGGCLSVASAPAAPPVPTERAAPAPPAALAATAPEVAVAPAPSIPLTELLVADGTGHTRRIGESCGPTLVYFWSTWCGPCRPAIRSLVALAPPSWRVLAVAVEDTPAAVAALLGSVPTAVHFVSATAARAAGIEALPRAWWRAADGLKFTPVPQPDWSTPWPWWFVMGTPTR